MTRRHVSRAILARLAVGMALVIAACGCVTYTTRVDDTPGRPQTYTDPASPTPMRGVGIDSHDIISMTDRMVRDMLASPALMNRSVPPRIVIDAEYFHNEGSARINRNLITDRLRVQLNRAAGGRLVFLGRHYADMVEKERDLENQGVVSEGTRGATQQAAGWDYRLGGRIATLDKISPSTGLQERYYQITFELVERGSGAIVWSNQYEFEKFDRQDVLYR